MYPNLSREKDERDLLRYPRSSIRGANLDRIRSVIERGGTPSSQYDDATLVRSIEQVVEYDPQLLQERDCAKHFLEYSIMQKTSAPVLKKLLELWPVTGQRLLSKAISDCESLPALREVLQDYRRMLQNREESSIARDATLSSANNQQQAAPASSNGPRSVEDANLCDIAIRHTKRSIGLFTRPSVRTHLVTLFRLLRRSRQFKRPSTRPIREMSWKFAKEATCRPRETHS